MNWELLLCTLGLVLIIEGTPYFIFPHKVKAWLLQLLQIDNGSLRIFGLLAMLAGLFLVWLGRSG